MHIERAPAGNKAGRLLPASTNLYAGRRWWRWWRWLTVASAAVALVLIAPATGHAAGASAARSETTACQNGHLAVRLRPAGPLHVIVGGGIGSSPRALLTCNGRPAVGLQFVAALTPAGDDPVVAFDVGGKPLAATATSQLAEDVAGVTGSGGVAKLTRLVSFAQPGHFRLTVRVKRVSASLDGSVLGTGTDGASPPVASAQDLAPTCQSITQSSSGAYVMRLGAKRPDEFSLPSGSDNGGYCTIQNEYMQLQENPTSSLSNEIGNVWDAEPPWTTLPAASVYNRTPTCPLVPANSFSCTLKPAALPPQDPFNPEGFPGYLNSAYWPAEKRPDLWLYAVENYGYTIDNCRDRLPHYCFLLDAEKARFPISHRPEVGDIWVAPCKAIFIMGSGAKTNCPSGADLEYAGYVEQVFRDGSFTYSQGGADPTVDSGLAWGWLAGRTDHGAEFIGLFPTGSTQPKSDLAAHLQKG